MPHVKNDIAITMTHVGMEMDAEYDSESDADDYNKRAKGNKKTRPTVRRKAQWWVADSEAEEDEAEEEGLCKRRSKKKRKESGGDGEGGRRDERVKTAGKKNVAEKEKRGSKIKGSKKVVEEEENMEKKSSNRGGKEKVHDKREKGDTSSSYSSSESESESLSEGELALLKEEVEEKKKLISTLRSKPWPLKRRLHSLKKAQEFIDAFETLVGKVRWKNTYTLKAMINKKLNIFKQEFENLKTMITPWQEKIKEVESHYGSTVAAYFIFLRWMFVISLIPFALVMGLIIIPEVVCGVPHGTIPRKTIPRNEQATAMDLNILYEFGGHLKYSVLFYGYYDNKVKIGSFGYHLPLAYLLVGILIFIYSLAVVIKVMAKNARNSDSTGDEDVFMFSWKVFTSWEYLIGDTEMAEEKSACIVLAFKESLVDDLRHFKNENLFIRILLRFVANILILSCLAGSGYLVYAVSKRQLQFSKMDRNQVSWLQKYEVEIVMSLLGMFLPPLFEGIAELEDYHPRIAQSWQLGRLFILFVGNIYTFVFAVIEKITDQLQAEMVIKNKTIFALQQYYTNYTLYHNVTENIPPPNINPANAIRGPCWETEMGIEFMKLVISDIQVTYFSIVIADIIRGVLVRYLNYCWCWDLEATFPCYGEFDISSNVITIIFNQGMVLMGTFYCPGLMSVNIFRLITSMYFQCWALKSSNIINRRIFHASRTSNIYLGIFLFVIIFCLLPVIVIIMTVSPSFDCGPFSGKNRMYDVIDDVILELPAFMKAIINYVFNPGIIMCMVIFLILAVYFLQKVSTGYHKTNMELKKKLEKEKEKNKKYSSNEVMKDEKDVLSDRVLIPEYIPEKPASPTLVGKLPVVNGIVDATTNGRGEPLDEDMPLADTNPWAPVTRPLIPRCPGPLPGYAHLLPPGLLQGRIGPSPVM